MNAPMASMLSLAVADGSYVLLAFMIVFFFAIVWGYYTRRGSDIAQRPSDGLGRGDDSEAPGAEGRSTIVGKVDGERDRFDTHGTK